MKLHLPDEARHGIDMMAVLTGFATLAKWLPPVAAAFSIVWLGIQIFDYLYHKKWRKPQ